MSSQESQRIEGTDNAIGPFWSPDGQFLGFFAQGKLKKVALDGGPPQNICTTTPGLGATWSQSGEIVFNPINRAPLMRVSASGGTPQQLTMLDASRHEIDITVAVLNGFEQPSERCRPLAGALDGTHNLGAG